MGQGGDLLRKWRKKRGLSLEALGGLVNMAASTVLHRETGARLASDIEISLFAEALKIDPNGLAAAFDRDRFGDVVVPFDDYLQIATKWVEGLEVTRTIGRPSVALTDAATCIEVLEARLQTIPQAQQSEIRRLLTKATISRAFALTMVVESPHIVSYMGNMPYWQEHQQYLSADDIVYAEMAAILPALQLYLAGRYGEAEKSLTAIVDATTDPYIRALGMRDLIVSAGKLKDHNRYLSAAKISQEMIDSGELSLVNCARLLEGRAHAELDLGLFKSLSTIEQAGEIYRLAGASGEFRLSVESQIARTHIRQLAQNEKVAGVVLEDIHSRINVIRRSGFERHWSDVLRWLRVSPSDTLNRLASSV